MGSGQFGSPWERIHRAKLAMPFHSCRTSAWLGPPPLLGSRCPQAWVAVWYSEVLAASCRMVALLNCPALLGSGKSATPWARTQRAKASALEFADPPAFGEPPELVDDGLPLHAAASRVSAPVVMIAAAVRAGGGHARRGLRMMRMLWFTVVSLWAR